MVEKADKGRQRPGLGRRTKRFQKAGKSGPKTPSSEGLPVRTGAP
jgi:hypothetical protein